MADFLAEFAVKLDIVGFAFFLFCIFGIIAFIKYTFISPAFGFIRWFFSILFKKRNKNEL